MKQPDTLQNLVLKYIAKRRSSYYCGYYKDICSECTRCLFYKLILDKIEFLRLNSTYELYTDSIEYYHNENSTRELIDNKPINAIAVVDDERCYSYIKCRKICRCIEYIWSYKRRCT